MERPSDVPRGPSLLRVVYTDKGLHVRTPNEEHKFEDWSEASDVVRRLIQTEDLNVFMDLRKYKSMTAVARSHFVRWYLDATDHERKMAFVVSGRVRTQLEIVGVLNIFSVFDAVEEALAALGIEDLSHETHTP